MAWKGYSVRDMEKYVSILFRDNVYRPLLSWNIPGLTPSALPSQDPTLYAQKARQNANGGHS